MESDPSAVLWDRESARSVSKLLSSLLAFCLFRVSSDYITLSTLIR